MGHGKLKKFEENKTFSCLLQPDGADVARKDEGMACPMPPFCVPG